MQRAARSLNDLVTEKKSVPLDLDKAGAGLNRHWSFANLIDDFDISNSKSQEDGESRRKSAETQNANADYFALNTNIRGDFKSGRVTVLERFQNKLGLNVIGILQKAARKLKEKEKKYRGETDDPIGLSLMDDNSSSNSNGSDGDGDGDGDDDDDAFTVEAVKAGEEEPETTEELLESLFYNISSRVEKSVAERLQLKRADVYYYELVASYYGLDEHVDTVERVMLPECVSLWSVELFPAVFALLMHRWVLKHDGQGKKGWLIRLNVLLKGTNQLFWFDTQHRTHRLLSLFCYIRNKISTTEAIDNERKRADYAHMLCRFYYYYRSSKLERVNEFLKAIHVSLDTFVLETTAHLCAVGENDTLRIHYLQCLTKLNGEKNVEDLEYRLERTTINKLHSTLNAFILPGAPFHPSVQVRNQARTTMAVLFPHGQWSRSAINGIFTLLRPNYWRSELVHFLEYLYHIIISFIPFLSTTVNTSNTR